MAIEPKKILEIATDSLDNLARNQVGLETNPDPELNYQMWGGKDGQDNITRWLAKDKPGQLESLVLTGTGEPSDTILNIQVGSIGMDGGISADGEIYSGTLLHSGADLHVEGVSTLDGDTTIHGDVFGVGDSGVSMVGSLGIDGDISMQEGNTADFEGSLTVREMFGLSDALVTTDYAIQLENCVMVNANGKNITMPAVSVDNRGRVIIIHAIRTTTGTTVNPPASQRINGSTSNYSLAAGAAVMLISDGIDNWFKIS